MITRGGPVRREVEASGDGWKDVGEVADCPQLTVEAAHKLQQLGLAAPHRGASLLPGLDTPGTRVVNSRSERTS